MWRNDDDRSSLLTFCRRFAHDLFAMIVAWWFHWVFLVCRRSGPLVGTLHKSDDQHSTAGAQELLLNKRRIFRFSLKMKARSSDLGRWFSAVTFL